jgi:hypothetical protein
MCAIQSGRNDDREARGGIGRVEVLKRGPLRRASQQEKSSEAAKDGIAMGDHGIETWMKQ